MSYRLRIVLICVAVAIGLSFLSSMIYVAVHMARIKESERNREKALDFYGNIDNYVSVAASIESAEPYDGYYKVVLKPRGEVAELGNIEYCEFYDQSVYEAADRGFDLTAGDNTYLFTFARRESGTGKSPFAHCPIVAVSETDGSREYLNFETGRVNLLIYVENK